MVPIDNSPNECLASSEFLRHVQRSMQPTVGRVEITDCVIAHLWRHAIMIVILKSWGVFVVLGW